MTFHGMSSGAKAATALALMLALTGCATAERSVGWKSLQTTSGDSPADAGVAPPRVSGPVLADDAPDLSRPEVTVRGGGRGPRAATSAPTVYGNGDITLNFAETDIREVVRVILGDLLQVTYTIDPAVKGTATLQTPNRIGRGSLVQVLESLLAQNQAQLIVRNGIYNVVPSAGGGLNLAAAAGGAGAAETTQVVYLRYASAPQLAKVLAPFIGPTSRVVAGPGGDTLLVSGSAMTRSSLIELIRSFDTDALAGRSYAIFPVSVADPDDVTNEVRSYVQTTAASGDGPVQVMTLPRINAVLVVTSNPNYLDQVGRFITQTNAVAGGNARRLHVYYVQNGTASDLASVLSKAFSPDSSDNQGNAGSVAPGLTPATVGSPSGSPDQSGQPTPTPASLTTSGTVTPSSSSLTSNSRSSFGSGSSSSSFGSQSSSRSPEPDTPVATKGIRFIPDKKNNALVIFATPAEYQVIEATLRKIDILPLQVMIDATIAEVTLNDNLEYGTQFFFKNGATRTTLSNADNGGITPAFPGFAFAFTTQDAQAAISALQSVTKVKVVSDPQLLVLNNESARLQVGDLVPVTTQSAVSTTTAGAPVVNSIEYKETGVILEVTPRVNSGGLVTLDIQQEVSDVVKTSTSNIDSPTIQQRKIKTRIVSQNGETIGLGGLIKDSDNVGNSGVPWLTDIPVLGALFGTRSRFAARTELLILLTPHVIQDQRTARALTEDLQEKLGSLSAIPIKRDPIEPPGPLRQ